jgi:hypothetical protein
MLDISTYKEKINDVCDKFNLKKLDLFGSAITSKFGPESDIDVLIEFGDNKNINMFNVYFDLKDELQSIFKRPIDIVVERSIKNPFFKRSINKTRTNVYVRRNK